MCENMPRNGYGGPLRSGLGGLGVLAQPSGTAVPSLSPFLRCSESGERADKVISESLREHSTSEASPVSVTLFSVVTPLLRC